MTNQDQKPKTTLASILEWVTGTIGKVTAVIVAITAFIPAVLRLQQTVGPPPAQVVASQQSKAGPNCYRVNVMPPPRMSISEVKSGRVSFDLRVENKCGEDLSVLVEFKRVGGGITITQAENPPAFRIEAGKTDYQRSVVPPNLSLLTETAQTVQIGVLVRQKDEKELFVDTYQIDLVV